MMKRKVPRSITLKMVRDVGKRKLLNIQTDRPQLDLLELHFDPLQSTI